MLKNLLVAAFLLMMTSCGGPRYVDFFPYHDDGTPKPKVVLLPVADLSGSQLPWDVPGEIKSGISTHLMDHGSLYLYSNQEVENKLSQIEPIDMFESDQTLANQYRGANFIVFMELIDYRYIPSKENCFTNCYVIPYKLQVRLRLKILDIRDATCPRIILQEIIQRSSPVARRYAKGDQLPDFQSEDYRGSSVGQVHEELIYTLANRIEENILRVY